MKAVVFRGKNDIRLEDVPLPTIVEPMDAIVKVTLSTICGSDLYILHESFSIPVNPGATLGHEFVGVIEEVGSGVRNFKVGDRVTASIINCGNCSYCREGRYSLCDKMKAIGGGEGFGGLGGAQAEYVRIPNADVCLWEIPKEISDEEAVFISDVLSTGFFATECGQIKPGDTVAVFGSGPVGLCAQITSRLFGPTQVIAVGHHDYRLKYAEEHGSFPINSHKEDPVAKIKEMTGGRGADVAIEATGNKEALIGALTCLKKGGNLSYVGVYTTPIETPWHEMMWKNISIKGGFVETRNIPKLVKLVQAQKISVRFLITHKLPLKEAVRGYELMDKRLENVLKVALVPHP